MVIHFRKVLYIQMYFWYKWRMTHNNETLKVISSSFFQSIGDPFALLDLFEFLPQIFLYIKDSEGRFVRLNQAMYQKLGLSSAEEAVGKNDFDFFPPAIAAQYVEEDRKVKESREPLIDQVWLVPNADGFPAWYFSSKMPVFDSENEVIGLAGFLRPYEFIGPAPAGYERLVPVVEYIAEHFQEVIELADLAEIAGISKSQFQREFSRLFGRSPSTYILEVRTSIARKLLENSEMSVLEISGHCGFYDQSHFSRQFKRCTGLRPMEYRKRYGTKD